MNAVNITRPDTEHDDRDDHNAEDDDGRDLQANQALALEAAWHLAMIVKCYTRALHPQDDKKMRDWMLDSMAHDAAPYADEALDHLAAIDRIHQSGRCGRSRNDNLVAPPAVERT